MAPRKLPALESRGDCGQTLEPVGHSRELLHLARRDPETLAGIVSETGEPELVMSVALQQRPREPPEHAAAERFPAGETAKLSVKHECDVAPPISRPGLKRVRECYRRCACGHGRRLGERNQHGQDKHVRMCGVRAYLYATACREQRADVGREPLHARRLPAPPPR